MSEGWSNVCPTCLAAIVDQRSEQGGEPLPEGMREQLDRGEALTQGCAPAAIKRIRLRCANGHTFDVERTQRTSEGRFQLEWQGLHKRLPDDFLGLTDSGWPRPRYRLMRNRTGEVLDRVLPVPWVTPVPLFSKTDPARRRLSEERKLCQVCGEGHEPGSEVLVFLNGGLRSQPEHERLPDPEKFKHVLLRAIDDSVMHERCAKLAAGNCPKLKEMAAAGDLWTFAGPIEAVDVFEDGSEPLVYSQAQRRALKLEGHELPEFETYLAMQGSQARLYQL
jgi:hypothetical protein